MRARSLKPGFFENEVLAELDPLARILFAGLWCYADRDGRFEWRTKRMKALILPYDKADIDKLLTQLENSAFIFRYSIDGMVFGWIPNFIKHQHPHPHEAKSIIPPPPTNIEQNQCHDMSLQCNDIPCNVRLNPSSLNPSSNNNKEDTTYLLAQSDKIIALEPKPSPAILVIPLNGKPKEFNVTEDDICEWQTIFPAVNVRACLELIRKWNVDNPQKRKTSRGIKKHITSWLAREQDKGGGTFKNESSSLSWAQRKELQNEGK